MSMAHRNTPLAWKLLACLFFAAVISLVWILGMARWEALYG